MRESLPKTVADKVGRAFNLMYNRVAMYHMNHPSTAEAIRFLSQAVAEGLTFVTPLTLVLDRERIYVEEEPLDPRVNTQRLVLHMKKTAVQSVSFDRGTGERDVAQFARVFGDPKTFPTADSMKQALVSVGVEKIKINHVFFKKVTADEEVVDREELLRSTGGALWGQVLVDQTVKPSQKPEGVTPTQEASPYEAGLVDYLGALTLMRLQEDPIEVSRILMGVEEGKGPDGSTSQAGQAILEGIRHLRAQVEGPEGELLGTQPLQSLVSATFKLKEEIQKGVRERRERGEALEEEAITRELDELTDGVMVQLVREEYRKGQISVKRLAQIIRRMMPDVRELKRLLPKLKEALLADGMELADYLQLIKELEKELQSEELAFIIEEGAEEIGVSAPELLAEMRKDPKSAAELIVMAAELRSLGRENDTNLLTQILVDYVEKISASMAVETACQEGPQGEERLPEIIEAIQRELIQELERRLKRSSVMEIVKEEAQRRIPQQLDEARRKWALRVFVGGEEGLPHLDPNEILGSVKRTYPDQKHQARILQLIMQELKAQGADIEPLKELSSQQVSVVKPQVDIQKVPKGCYNRTGILVWLRQEARLIRRYPYSCSLVLMGVQKAVSLKPVPLGFVKPHEVRNLVMEEILPRLRDTDLVGCLDENRILLILPFTGKNGVLVVKRRLEELLTGKVLKLGNIPLRVNVASVSETMKKETVSSITSLISKMERELDSLLKGR
jgi:hypothetical protein